MNIYEIGMTKGTEIGEKKKLISLVCRKLAKNHSVEEIADMLEETPDSIQEIVTVAQKYAPEYDTDTIYKELCKSKQV